MLELVRPQGHVVLGIAGPAEDDRVDQRHGVHVGVLQQRVGRAHLLFVTHPEARRIEHGKVVPGFELRTDMQRDRLDAAGGGLIPGLAQGEREAGRGHDLHIL